MNSKLQKEISDIVQTYNRHAVKILNLAVHYAPDDPNIDWLKRIIKIVRNESPTMIIEKGLDKLWDNRENILKKDVEFFKYCSLDKYIKKDENKVWLDEIVKLVRQKYFDLSLKEQDIIWSHIQVMLECVIKYRLNMGDYKE